MRLDSLIQCFYSLAVVGKGAQVSRPSGEGDIRCDLIEANLVETAMRECAPQKPEGTPQVASGERDNRGALPCQLFTNTQIPACIWFLKKNKAKQEWGTGVSPVSSKNHSQDGCARLTAELADQFAESAIKANLIGLGYAL